MKPFLTIAAAALAAIASSCSSADPAEPAVKVEFARPVLPAEARKACAAPAILPGRDLTEKEVTNFWGRDRAALVQCEYRRSAAVKAMESETP